MTSDAVARDVAPFAMTIGGEPVATEQTFGVINPATGEVFAESPDCTAEQLDLAVDAATQAFRQWSRDEDRRRRAVLACADVIEAHAEQLAALRTREQGMVLKDSLRFARRWPARIRDFATIPIPVEVVQDDDVARVELRRRPLGVVAAIAPWNFPVLLAMAKVVNALIAGNTVVLKPSPYTPLTTLRIGELLCDVLPPGVLNVVAGGDDLGSLLTHHPGVSKISFTGSVEAGLQVAAAAAKDLKRVTLELGGNDAAIVLDDVDVDRVTDALIDQITFNCGQVCIAVKRVYVHEHVYPALVEALAERAGSLRLGDGMDPDTDMGPLCNAMQVERVTELVDDAKAAGGQAVTGGQRPARPGYFYPATIVTNVSDGVRLVDEEQFGPVLPVMPFADVEDAVRRANATTYGLGGSVWSADTARATEVASQLECGVAWVNRHTRTDYRVPMGGWKSSGIGVERGVQGLDAYCRLQAIDVPKS